MSAIISINKGGICGICRNDFALGEHQITHVGGEKHEGFHTFCLKPWLEINPTCPLDRETIDKNSLLSRTEKVFQRLKACLVGFIKAEQGPVVAMMGAGVVGGAILGAKAEVGAAIGTVIGTVTVLGTLLGDVIGIGAPKGFIFGGVVGVGAVVGGPKVIVAMIVTTMGVAGTMVLNCILYLPRI
jgi:hypothetical protein